LILESGHLAISSFDWFIVSINHQMTR